MFFSDLIDEPFTPFVISLGLSFAGGTGAIWLPALHVLARFSVSQEVFVLQVTMLALSFWYAGFGIIGLWLEVSHSRLKPWACSGGGRGNG